VELSWIAAFFAVSAEVEAVTAHTAAKANPPANTVLSHLLAFRKLALISQLPIRIQVISTLAPLWRLSREDFALPRASFSPAAKPNGEATKT
jgi:hypothetical protein